MRRLSGLGGLRSSCANGVEAPHAHVGVPFSIEFARRNLDLCLDGLSRRKFLDFIDLICPADQTNRARVLFFGLNDKLLFAPRSAGTCSFSQGSESDDFSNNFHSDVYLMI